MAAFDAPAPVDSPAGDLEPEDAVGLPPIPVNMPAAPTAWSSANQPAAEPDEAPVPGFLAGRSEREPLRPRATRPDVQFREKVTREDLVPSWDLTSRYGATLKEERGGGGGGGGDRFGGLMTAAAVVAILALGVAGVIFLPGLLSGGGHPATPTPPVILTASPTLPSGGTSSLPPDATATPEATIAPSEAPSATPEATPHLYRIKSGDQLYKIAKRFHVTVADILAANPQITDPDHIVVGQVIVIPPRAPEPTPTPTATP
jgi:LysM repeat protein